MTNQQIAGFPHGMHLNVFVCTEIPRDQLSFRVIHTPHTYKGVRNYKYRTVINRIDIPCAGWIIEDICVCESVRLCIPWAQVSVPTTCPLSLLPSFNPSFCPPSHSLASVIKQRLVWHESKRETQTAVMPSKVHLSQKAVICSVKKIHFLKYFT